MNEKKVTGSVSETNRKGEKEVEKTIGHEPTQSHGKVRQLKGTAKWRAGQLEDTGKAGATLKEAMVPDVKDDFWHKVRPTPE